MNNTLTKAEKDRDKAKETDTYTDKDITKPKEKDQDNTTGKKESLGEIDVNTGQENTTAVSREDKYTGTIPEKTAAEGGNEGEQGERNTGSEKPTGGKKDKVDSQGPDNSLNTVEKKEPEIPKSPEKKGGSSDTNLETGKTDITEIVVIKEKGQEDSERKEKQMNGKRDPDKIGPNDTKLSTIISVGDNTVEIFELEMTKNNTVTYDTRGDKKENNTIGSPTPGRRIISSQVNMTQYRAEKPASKMDQTDKDSSEKTKVELAKEREEKEKEKEREVNQSFNGK